jgi:hypothetical protein
MFFDMVVYMKRIHINFQLANFSFLVESHQRDVLVVDGLV